MKRAEDHYGRASKGPSADEQFAGLPLLDATPSNDPPVHQVSVTAHTRTLTGQAALDAKQRETERDLDARFAAFHAEHPEVFMRLLGSARALRDGGATRIGVKRLVEDFRWTSEQKLSVNNSYVSRYARLLVETDATLAELIELRSLTSKQEAAA